MNAQQVPGCPVKTSVKAAPAGWVPAGIEHLVTRIVGLVGCGYQEGVQAHRLQVLDITSLANKPGLLLPSWEYSTSGIRTVSHNSSYALSELLSNLSSIDASILNGIVEESCYRLLLIALIFPDKRTDSNQMRNVGHLVLTFAALASVELICPGQGIAIVGCDNRLGFCSVGIKGTGWNRRWYVRSQRVGRKRRTWRPSLSQPSHGVRGTRGDGRFMPP